MVRQDAEGRLMLRVTFDLLPGGDESRLRTIGLMEIANIKTRPDGTADYAVALKKTPPFSGALRLAWKRGKVSSDDSALNSAMSGEDEGNDRRARGRPSQDAPRCLRPAFSRPARLWAGGAAIMGSAHVLVASELRSRLYAEPALRGDIAIVSDTPFDDEGTHLLRVISERLGPGTTRDESHRHRERGRQVSGRPRCVTSASRFPGPLVQVARTFAALRYAIRRIVSVANSSATSPKTFATSFSLATPQPRGAELADLNAQLRWRAEQRDHDASHTV
jgi:hypothetical protein